MVESIYGNLYVTNFSLLFLITIFYWVFLEHNYTYYSIGCHAVLGAVIYLPFIYEWIEVRAKNLIQLSIVAITYQIFNVIYVKSSGKTIYSILDWETGTSVAYAALALVLVFFGYCLGYQFSWLRTKGSQGPETTGEIKDNSVHVNDGKGKVELMPMQPGHLIH